MVCTTASTAAAIGLQKRRDIQEIVRRSQPNFVRQLERIAPARQYFDGE